MVKWSAELDQMLLVKVLEACEVRPTTAQFQAMAATWPEHLERPTDRAISEHLFILRKKANAVMGKAAKDSPGKSTPKKNAPKVNDGTPRKTPAKVKAGGKRKHVDDDDDTTSTDGVTLAAKLEDPDAPYGETIDFPMPTKKSRAPTSSPSKPTSSVTNPAASASKPAPEVQNGGLMYDGSTDYKGWVKLEDGLEMEAI